MSDAVYCVRMDPVDLAILELMVESVNLTDNASMLQKEIKEDLERGGFVVEAEVKTPLGRIDLVVSEGSRSVAIELDNKFPRANSLKKLRQFDGGRIVGLRDTLCTPPKGIDAVVGLATTQRGGRR